MFAFLLQVYEINIAIFNRYFDRCLVVTVIFFSLSEFTEKSVAGEKIAAIFCKVYFAIDFRKLRKLIFPEGEDE